ncbi:aldo/keto reductase, partial [uncultured Planktomarina sp.]|uniref:aldo/keto reductase n=1 Tax=uncultured Planktomarina sp. TaxID=1538529 RepID=UPI003261CCA6
PLVTNQIEISVLETGAFTNGDLAFLQERDVPAMAWSPLAGGALFSGDNPRLLALLTELGQGDAAAAAVAWLLVHPARIMPVLGTNNLNRIKNLGAALKVCIDRETWFDIYTCAIEREVA